MYLLHGGGYAAGMAHLVFIPAIGIVCGIIFTLLLVMSKNYSVKSAKSIFILILVVGVSIGIAMGIDSFMFDILRFQSLGNIYIVSIVYPVIFYFSRFFFRVKT